MVFGLERPRDIEVLDYALVIADKNENPEGFVTCRKIDAFFTYFQSGGAFPGTKGTLRSVRHMQEFVRWHWDNTDTKWILSKTENTNIPMLKLGFHCGFRIIGTQNLDGITYVDMTLKREENGNGT